MNRLMVGFIALIIVLANALAEPQRIEDPKPPCDNLQNTDKPPCDPAPTRKREAAPTPTQRDDVTVPPDIPAEGLPHQDGRSSSDDSTSQPR